MTFKEFGEVVKKETPKFKEYGQLASDETEDSNFLRKPSRLVAQYAKGALNRNPYIASYNLATTAIPAGAHLSRQRVSAQAQKDLDRMDEKIARGEPLTRLERIHYERTKELSARKSARASTFDTDTLINKAVKATTGIDLEPEDLSENVAHIAGALLRDPSKLLELPKKIPQLLSKAKPPAAPFHPGVERTASGLPKVRALEAKAPRFARLTKGQQEKALGKLDEEATRLTQTKIRQKLPITEQIEKGVNFEEKFEKSFGNLQRVAEKANPEINTSPIFKLMHQQRRKYRGVPELDPQAKKIVRESQLFSRKSPSDLSSLLRTYRSNNRKIKDIYETSRVTGKQKDYVDFLVDYNKSIANSIKSTLPADSAWVKSFEGLNKEYKNFKDAYKVQGMFKQAGSDATPQGLLRLANDSKRQKQLALAIGEKEAEEIVQIGKDLKAAQEAIKKIPVKKFLGKGDIPAAAILYPALKFLGIPYAGFKAAQGLRYIYGKILSSPSIRRNYGEMLKAIASRNSTRIQSTYAHFIKALEESEED